MRTELGETVSRFAISLLQEMISDTENVFFSSASLAVVLSMTLAGADGNTNEQILEVLKCGEDEAATHQAFKRLVKVIEAPRGWRTLFTRGQSCILYAAYRLYSMKNFEVDRSFANQLASNYRSDFKQVDFTDSTVRDEINQWVSGVTKGKITEVIPEGLLDRDSRFVLMNAIYFKGKWLEKFNDSLTYDEDFYVSASEKRPVKMMKTDETNFLYSENDTCQAIQLPYRGNSLCMVIILPKEIDGLLHLVNQLKADMFLNIISSMDQAKVVVHLPRFRIDVSYNLPAELTKLGMKDMFLPDKANFSRITKDPVQLCVSDVIHKASVEVNEEGTEAVAASAVHGKVYRAAQVIRRIIFKADHPFVFSIFHRGLDCPLFYGTLVQPQE